MEAVRRALTAAGSNLLSTPDKKEAIDNLQNQLLTQWKQLGVPSIGGGLSVEDRARSLANRLYENQIYDLSKIRISDNASTPVPVYSRVDVRYTDSGPEYGFSSNNGEFSTWTPLTPEQAATVVTTSDPEGGLMAQYQTGMRARNPDEVQQQLVYEGRRIGFLGNADDGGRNADPTGYLQPGGLASWTAAGKGAVGYTAKAAPNGQVYFVPSWGSTSDVSTIAPLVGLGLMFVPGLQGVGASLGTALGASGTAASALGNAIIQGTLAEATGGDFLKGAAAGALGSYVPGVQSEIAGALGGGAAANVAAGALTGGAMSELTGGDFAQGALMGGIGSGVQQLKASAVDDVLQSLPTPGYDVSTAPTEVDILEAIAAESPNFKISDTSFTPNYSLSSGASGEPGLALKPLDTEYQVGSFDYTLGDLIDNLGLQMPTTPNLESMGGGQGIVLKTRGGYITEQGFVPDSYVASLGDPESFINKPVIDVGLSLGELKEATPDDISKKLAGLDIAKALAPSALAALTKKVVDIVGGDSSSGFQIVPVPSDWRSPEYNMAFTPSAPIDFGSTAMLQGTQWANPINLSSVINTLNQPMIAPETQQMMTQFQAPTMPYETGINDIIGNLGGQPVSIADIISGIQSGQNYSI